MQMMNLTLARLRPSGYLTEDQRTDGAYLMAGRTLLDGGAARDRRAAHIALPPETSGLSRSCDRDG